MHIKFVIMEDRVYISILLPGDRPEGAHKHSQSIQQTLDDSYIHMNSYFAHKSSPLVGARAAGSTCGQETSQRTCGFPL